MTNELGNVYRRCILKHFLDNRFNTFVLAFHVNRALALNAGATRMILEMSNLIRYIDNIEGLLKIGYKARRSELRLRYGELKNRVAYLKENFKDLRLVDMKIELTQILHEMSTLEEELKHYG